MRYHSRYIFFVIFLFITHCTLAQTSRQSEQDTLKYLAELVAEEQNSPMEIIEFLNPIITRSKQLGWQNVYLEAATQKAEKLVELEQMSALQTQLEMIIPTAKKAGDIRILVRLAICELNVLERAGYSQELDSKYRYLLNKVETIDDDKTIGLIYLAAGRVNSRLADYSEALNSLGKAYVIAEKLGDLKLLDEVCGELGTVNIRMENFDEGIVYYLKSLEISQTKKDKYSESVILYNLGKAYLLSENFEKSKEMYYNSVSINLELKDDIGLMWSKRGLADLALKQQQWRKAIELYNETTVFFAKIDDKSSQFITINGQAEAYIAINDAHNAKISLAASKRLLSYFPNPENTLRYQQLLANLASLNGNFKAAFEITKNNMEILKSAYFEKKKEEVEKQRIKLDSQFKDTVNKELIEKNQLQKFKIAEQQKQQNLWYLIICLSVISLLVVSFMLYKQIRLRERFKTMALRDDLTRSPNRRAILEYANSCFTNSIVSGKPLIIGLVDLDNFKRVNDTYGHDVGDNVLIAFAKACRNSMRDTYEDGKYGRYGGEEWLIVLPDTSKSVAEDIFRRLKETFSNLNIEGLPNEYKVTFSVGVQILDKNIDKNVSGIISKADSKLYIAKENGKDRVIF